MTRARPKYKPGDDLLMMQDPGEWPLVTLLPLKSTTQKRGQFGAPGFLVCSLATETVKPIVYFGTIYDYQNHTKLADIPHREYDSFEAIIDDNWIVD